AVLSNSVVVRSRAFPRLGLDYQRYRPGDQPDWRAKRAAFLASVGVGCPVGNRWRAIPSTSGRRASYPHASAHRILHGRGHVQNHFCVDNTTVSELGLGFGKRRHWHTAVLLSLGQPSSNSDLAARRTARDPAHL